MDKFEESLQDGKDVLTKEQLNAMIDGWGETLDQLQELHERLLDICACYTKIHALA